MPYRLQSIRPGPLIVATFEGDVTGAELLASFEEAFSWLQRHPGPLNALWDLRGATSLFVMEADMAAGADALGRVEHLATGGRAAYIARPDQTLVLGLAKALLTGLDGARRARQGFTDYDAALTWLGVSQTAEGASAAAPSGADPC